jgi:hypothetical protein
MQRVTLFLSEHGPMTAQDVARDMAVKIELARGMLGKAKHCGQVRIVGYRRDEDSGRLYTRAVYAAGSGPDAKRIPPLTRNEYNRRYRSRKSRAVASVWMLAVPVEHRRIGAATIGSK